MATGLRYTLCWLSIFGSACVDSLGAPEIDIASSEFAIVGGAANGGDPAVGILLHKISVCSMTVIYGRFGITARHCVQENKKDKDTGRIIWGALHNAAEMRISFDRDPGAESIWYGVVDYRYHTKADVAVLELNAAPGPSVQLNTTDIGPFVGRPVRITGFGKTRSRPENTSERSGVKRVGFSTMFRTATLPDIGPSIITGLLDTQVGGAKLCQGDSGGPAFMQVNGQEVLVGVNSVVARRPGTKGAIVCENQDTYNAHARIDLNRGWIDESISDMDGGTTSLVGGCSASGSGALSWAMLALLFACVRRRRPRYGASR